jgi:DNA-binding NtrC family response regulator
VQVSEGGGEASMDLRVCIRQFEAKLIVTALEATRGNQTQAARILNIPLRTLAYKLKVLKIRRGGYRAQ